jgi:carbamoyl-phosphate synthase large subunit
VLVTAVNGDLGQAIVKALRLAPEPLAVLGCDAARPHVGACFVAHYEQVPHAASADAYCRALDKLCRAHDVAAVIPASEPEIGVLSRLEPRRLPCGAAVICHGADIIDTLGDKLHCYEYLAGRVELAPFADGLDEQAVARLVRQVGYPLLVKGRKSSGSRSIRLTSSEEDLRRAIEATTDPVVQQYLADEGGEYSVGVFRREAFLAVIIFRRNLGPSGCSWNAETVDDDAVAAYARRIAELVPVEGSFNIQVRKGEYGVRLLEINPRFSSLVAARACAGFPDVQWSLDLAWERPHPAPPGPYRKLCFRRFFHEVVDLGEGFSPVPAWQPFLPTHLRKDAP